jgi:uncharacterized membrane protein YbhN (UPF0104 family)
MQSAAVDWLVPIRVFGAAGAPRDQWRRCLRTATSGGITVAVLGLIVFDTMHHAMVQSLHAVSVPLALLALIPALLIPVLGGLRWWIVLRGMGRPIAPVASLVELFSVANVVGQLLPSLAADGLRGWLAIRRGYRSTDVAQSIILERSGMTLALLGLLVATEPLLLARIGRPATTWLCPSLLGIGVGAFVVMSLADKFGLGPWRVSPAIQDMAATARHLTSSGWGLAAFLLSLASQVNFVLLAALLGQTLGQPVSFLDCLAVIPLAIAATALPISLGGWGVREGTLVVVFGTMGVPIGGALILSLSYGLYAALSSLPGFVGWWVSVARHGLTPGEATR